VKEFVKKIFLKLRLAVVSADRHDDLVRTEQLSKQLLDIVSKDGALNGQSKAQLHQDIAVLLTSNFKQGGYFVEFGATNGVDLSNTYLLEKHYQWRGIVAEPAKIWHKQLKQNRRCHVEFDCVWHTSGQTLAFNSVGAGELSTIAEYSDSDRHLELRKDGEIYNVSTISLNDLLVKYDAPELVDYLSIDTEGSEVEILEAFDFNQHKIAIIHVEHNYIAEKRDALHDLLSKNGYQRRYQNLSQWDDWYYCTDLT